MAKATYVSKGDTIDYTPGADVAAGDVVVISGTNSKIVGVALSDIKSGKQGAVAVSGVFEFVKASADVIDIGEKVYWHTTNLNVTEVATGAVLLGNAVETKGNGATTIKVRLPFTGI